MECIKCGNQLKGRQVKYCSSKCESSYYFAHLQKKACNQCGKQCRRSESPSQGICLNCSKAKCIICQQPYYKKVQWQLACSADCQKLRDQETQSQYNQKRLKRVACIHCGKPVSRKYCSLECKKASNKISKSIISICLNCGELTLGYRQKKYCGHKCAASVASRRRRARKKEAFVENVALKDVIEKSNCICQICLEPVDLSLDWPDLRSASIDHIHPLCKGGKHSLANTQLTHFGCNMSKGTD